MWRQSGIYKSLTQLQAFGSGCCYKFDLASTVFSIKKENKAKIISFTRWLDYLGSFLKLMVICKTPLLVLLIRPSLPINVSVSVFRCSFHYLGTLQIFNEIVTLVKSQLSHSKSIKQQSTQRCGQWAMFSTSSCRGEGEDNPQQLLMTLIYIAIWQKPAVRSAPDWQIMLNDSDSASLSCRPSSN